MARNTTFLKQMTNYALHQAQAPSLGHGGFMDTEPLKPQIATLLPDGSYGQRDMTEQEEAAYLELQASAPSSLGHADE